MFSIHINVYYRYDTYMVTRTHTWLPEHYIHVYSTYMVTRTLHTWLLEHYIHVYSTYIRP